MDYQQVSLDKAPARGRNGVFDAELIEFTIRWQEPEHVPILVVEVWSRRRAEGQAPIRFELTPDKTFLAAGVMSNLMSQALQRKME